MEKRIDEIFFDLKNGILHEKKELIRKIEQKIKNSQDEDKDFDICVGYIDIEDSSEAIQGSWNICDGYKYFNSPISDYSIFSIFVNEDYSTILKLIEENRNYNGFFIADDFIKYRFEYKIIFNLDLLENEKQLKEFMYQNDLKTFPYFNPYIRKVFDVKVQTIIDEENFKDKVIVDIDLGELSEKYNISIKTCPVWNVNIKKEEVLALSVVPVLNDTLFCVKISSNDNYISLVKSKYAKIKNIIKNNEIKSIYFDKEIKNWDICKIYKNVKDIDVVKGKFKISNFNSLLSKLDKYKLLSKFELIKTLDEICKKIDLECLGYSLKMQEDFKEIDKYINSFKYPLDITNDFIKFEDTRKNIYLKFKKQNSSIFEDKINFVLVYMQSLYENINWNGVYYEE